MPQDYKVYVLNLERSKERRASIEKQLQALGLEYEIFPAIDGRKLSLQEINQLYDFRKAIQWQRPLTLGEIGCAAGHLAIYERFLASGADKCLILEDDATVSPDVPAFLASAREFPPDWDLVLLYSNDPCEAFGPAYLGKYFLGCFPGSALGAVGIFYQRRAVELLLQAGRPISKPSDGLTSDSRSLLGLQIYGVQPMLITTTVATTDIGWGRAPLALPRFSRQLSLSVNFFLLGQKLLWLLTLPYYHPAWIGRKCKKIWRRCVSYL